MDEDTKRMKEQLAEIIAYWQSEVERNKHNNVLSRLIFIAMSVSIIYFDILLTLQWLL